MSTATQAPAVRSRGILDIIQSENVRQQVALALPKFLTPERMLRIAVTTINRNPKLQECTPASLLSALMQASQMGIEPDGRHGHLIARFNKNSGGYECQFQPDYKGLVRLIRHDPNVNDVYAVAVREGDTFVLKQGLHRDLVHEPDPFGSGELKGAYAVINYKDGSTPSFVWMNRADIEAVREHSESWKTHLAKGYSTPWKTDEAEMWKKSAINRLAKLADLSPDVADRVALDVETTVERLPEPIPTPRIEAAPHSAAALPAPERATAPSGEEAAGKIGEKKKAKLAKAQAVAAPETKPEPAKADENGPTPGGEPEAAEIAAAQPAAVLPVTPHGKLRAAHPGFSDAEILQVLVRYNLAEPSCKKLDDVPPQKIERALEDPETIAGELGALRVE